MLRAIIIAPHPDHTPPLPPYDDLVPPVFSKRWLVEEAGSSKGLSAMITDPITCFDVLLALVVWCKWRSHRNKQLIIQKIILLFLLLLVGPKESNEVKCFSLKDQTKEVLFWKL